MYPSLNPSAVSRALALLALFAPCFASPAFAELAPLAELAADAGADRTEKLIAGARREGTVTVYSSAAAEDMAVIAAAFEKKYGVKVRLWRGSSENIVQRAVVEARGGRPAAPGMDRDPVQHFRRGLQHRARQGASERLPRPHGPQVEGKARRRGRGQRLVRRGRRRAGRGPGSRAVPRDRRVQRHIGAQRPYPLGEPRSLRGGPVRAHHLRLQGRAAQEGRGADRMARRPARRGAL